MKIKKISQSAGVVATVADTLLSNSTTDALSAKQGKILNEKIKEMALNGGTYTLKQNNTDLWREWDNPYTSISTFTELIECLGGGSIDIKIGNMDADTISNWDGSRYTAFGHYVEWIDDKIRVYITEPNEFPLEVSITFNNNSVETGGKDLDIYANFMCNYTEDSGAISAEFINGAQGDVSIKRGHSEYKQFKAGESTTLKISASDPYGEEINIYLARLIPEKIMSTSVSQQEYIEAQGITNNYPIVPNLSGPEELIGTFAGVPLYRKVIHSSGEHVEDSYYMPTIERDGQYTIYTIYPVKMHATACVYDADFGEYYWTSGECTYSAPIKVHPFVKHSAGNSLSMGCMTTIEGNGSVQDVVCIFEYTKIPYANMNYPYLDL